MQRDNRFRVFSEPYTLLIVCVLITSANLGLINRVVSLKSTADENVLGLRDVFVALALVFGVFVGRGKSVFRNGLVRVALGILLLVPIATAVGFANYAARMALAASAATMATWAFAPILGRYLQNPDRLLAVSRMIVIIGVLVAAGVFIEVLSGGQFALVTPATDSLARSMRSTPTGWPTMMLASSILAVLVLSDRGVPSRTQFQRIVWLGLILMASLLTQSRTLLAGISLALAVYLAVAAVRRPSLIRWGYLVVASAVSVAVFPLVFVLGASASRSDFSGRFVDRYSVFTSSDAAAVQMERDGRVQEAAVVFEDRFPESPLLGFGLASPYREGKPWTIVHDIYAFFLLRFGLPGLLLWVIFVLLVLRSVFRSVRNETRLGLLEQALSVGMLNLVICATFGNIFGEPYCIQQAMIGLGCLIACQEMSRSGVWARPSQPRL
jgi:hypothetical protein